MTDLEWCAAHSVQHAPDGWGEDCLRADVDTATELAHAWNAGVEHKRAEGLEPYDVTEWRGPFSGQSHLPSELYCEWCDEGSDITERHRHLFYVHREGSAQRTADDLAQTFLFDVAALVPTYVVPAELAELDTGTGSGWAEDSDLSQALSDECDGAAESALSDVGLFVRWDDGYVVEEIDYDRSREFQVPIIVTVCVSVASDGTITVTDAYPDVEGAPWAYSAEPTAYELERAGVETLEWFEDERRDEDVVNAWTAAYDAVTVTVNAETAP